jgi:hypothetical protein
MAISYYGYTISPNQLETGEGFLICRNVPLARTGEQDYLGTEIGINCTDVIKVNRDESEVFSAEAMASFEGKPVTNNHPPVLLDSENAGQYEKGHVQNIRRGSGEWADYLVGDLHIHDAELIEDIKNSKREISCGYECEYDEEDGAYSQKNIRGNHVAVVETGRAGHKAAIMDSNTSKPKQAERKKKMSKKSTFFKIFGQAANGKSDDELTQLAMDAADAFEEEKAEEKVEEKTEDTDPMQEIMDAIKAINDRLDKIENPVEEEIEVDPLDEALEKLQPEEEKGGEEAVVVPAEEMDGCGKALDAAELIKAVKPAVSAITDEAQRKAVTDALIEAIKKPGTDLGKVMDASASHAEKVHTVDTEEIQNAYANMNPHTRKEDK